MEALPLIRTFYRSFTISTAAVISIQCRRKLKTLWRGRKFSDFLPTTRIPAMRIASEPHTHHRAGSHLILSTTFCTLLEITFWPTAPVASLALLIMFWGLTDCRPCRSGRRLSPCIVQERPRVRTTASAWPIRKSKGDHVVRYCFEDWSVWAVSIAISRSQKWTAGSGALW